MDIRQCAHCGETLVKQKTLERADWTNFRYMNFGCARGFRAHGIITYLPQSPYGLAAAWAQPER